MPFPFSLLQNVHLLCRGPEGFPRTAGNGIHGMSLVSSHTWILHKFICQKINAIFFIQWTPERMCMQPHAAQPHSVPVLSGFTLPGLFRMQRCWHLSAGPLADPQVSLAPAPCTAQPVLEPTSSLRKGFVISFQCTYCDWEFHWSHAIKLYRELNVIALSTLGQYT